MRANPEPADAMAALPCASADAGLVHGWVRLRPADDEAQFQPAGSARRGFDCFEAAGASLVVRSSAAQFARLGSSLLLLLGRAASRRLTGVEQRKPADSDARRLLMAWRGGQENLAASVRGRFAVVAIDLARGRAYLACDRFATIPLYVAVDGDRLAFADRADRVPLRTSPAVEPSALLRYVYFHCLPAAGSMFSGVRRLRAAEEAVADPAGLSVRPHWSPVFLEDVRPYEQRREEFRGLLRDAVRRELDGDAQLGTFLSGGTDSSTVTGLLGEISGRAPRAYSIGFDAAGYDEMEYARIAARHFHAQHRIHYVTPEELVRYIPAVAAYFDQPFGNSSALPSLICAMLARADGIARILAGDGGDELFGGNSRYAKQKVFAFYERVPAWLRGSFIEPLLAGSWAQRVPLLRKTRSYVLQARVPMPARMETYNLLSRIGPENLFAPSLLREVDLQGPAEEQRQTYERVADDASLVNRMLAYDWQYTLADSDLPKVRAAAEMAGLEVGFPMLDDDLLEFSLRLPSADKVRGLQLRYFFKEALRGFLPDEILRKAKHGFGLPFGVWLTQHDGLRALAQDALGGLGSRGFVRPQYLRELDRQVQAHAGYFGELVWILMMLEHWLRVHAPSFELR